MSVELRSSDPLVRGGLAQVLDAHPCVRLAGPDAEHAVGVLVLAEERTSAAHLAGLHDGRALRGADAPLVVLVTDHLDQADLLRAVDAGVTAVLPLSAADRAQLSRAVVAVAEGRGQLPPRLQGALAAHVRRIRQEVLDPNGLTFSGLTARECDVLRLVADGLDTEAIARRLSFSERTVKYVLTHLMTRCGLRSRAHAVAFAVRHGAI